MQSLIIDGVNINALCPQVGYEVEYESRDGGQGGLMLNGEEREDELAVKSVLNIPMFPLTEDQFKSLLELVMGSPLHQVQYYDPWKGTRTMVAKRVPLKGQYAGKGGTGNEYWKGIVLQFREK